MRCRGYHFRYHFGTLDGGEERVEAGPVLPLRAGGVLVDEDIVRVDRPALRRCVLGPALNLAPSGPGFRVPVAVVGTLAGVDGGDHVWGFPPSTSGTAQFERSSVHRPDMHGSRSRQSRRPPCMQERIDSVSNAAGHSAFDSAPLLFWHCLQKALSERGEG